MCSVSTFPKYTLIFFVVIGLCGKSISENHKLADVIEEIFDGYDKRIRPFHGEKPLEISMNASILDIYDIDDMRHEFTISMYLRSHWTDPKLHYDNHLIDEETDRILLDAEHSEKLWIHDTFILNQRKSGEDLSEYFRQVTVVYPDGQIRRSTKISTTVACFMDLSHFPFDQQICSIEFGSYGHAAQDIIYKWMGQSLNSGTVSAYTTNSQFHITRIIPKEEIHNSHGVNVSKFSIELTFVRSPGRYLTSIFFPSFVLCLISLMTLWMEQHGHEQQQQSRILISCLVLGVYTLFLSLSAGELTRVSYQTAIDSYLFFSFTLILIVTLTNFVMSHVHCGKGHPTKSERYECVEMHQVQQQLHSNSRVDLHDGFKVGRPTISTKIQDVILKIFSTLRVILPMTFFAFNFAYWTVILFIRSSQSNSTDLMNEDETFHKY